MLRYSLQETKYDLLLLLLLPLLQPLRSSLGNSNNNNSKKKNKKKHSSGMRVAPKRDNLHFSDLQYIYICTYALHTYAIYATNITISY